MSSKMERMRFSAFTLMVALILMGGGWLSTEIAASRKFNTIVTDKNELLDVASSLHVPTPTNTALRRAFHDWMAKHNKVWHNAEEMARRLEAFADNLRYVEARNRQLKEEGASYHLGLNSFAHLSYDDFHHAYLQDGGYVDHVPRRRNGAADNQLSAATDRAAAKSSAAGYMYENVTDIPESMDWRERGAVVTTVKDQAQCGSCWAFSTVATVESAHQIATGELVSLSEQELVDCDRTYNMGCNGGLMDYAFQFIIDNGGLDTEADYPYTARSGRCNARKKKLHVVSIDGYEDVPESDEEALVKAVAHQPVSVAIDAGGRDFQLYQGGVFMGSCGKRLNHAVVVVGYGHEEQDDRDYWVVRNSWGSGWGEGGYVRMERIGATDRDGLCGINMGPSFPIITPTTSAVPSSMASHHRATTHVDHNFLQMVTESEIKPLTSIKPFNYL